MYPVALPLMAGRKKEFDPLAYIESAFLDTRTSQKSKKQSEESDEENGKPRERFRKTAMSAPRPRRKGSKEEPGMDPEIREIWERIPRNIGYLLKYYDDDETANYYEGDFKESRRDLIRRLLDPEMTLAEVSRLLGVVPATVRRYTNRGWLKHHRTPGGQRRFRLSDVVLFIEEHGRLPEG